MDVRVGCSIAGDVPIAYGTAPGRLHTDERGVNLEVSRLHRWVGLSGGMWASEWVALTTAFVSPEDCVLRSSTSADVLVTFARRGRGALHELAEALRAHGVEVVQVDSNSRWQTEKELYRR